MQEGAASGSPSSALCNRSSLSSGNRKEVLAGAYLFFLHFYVFYDDLFIFFLLNTLFYIVDKFAFYAAIHLLINVCPLKALLYYSFCCCILVAVIISPVVGAQ